MTNYGYNINTGVLEWVQYPEDTAATRTEYTYDSMYRQATAECTTDTGLNQSVSYQYQNDKLTAVGTPTAYYMFGYGAFGQIGMSTVNCLHIFAEYEYTDDANRYLQQLRYGNSNTVNYTYDNKGRLLTETYEDGDTVSYAYDNNGALATVTDSATGRTTKYYYDLTDRMMKYTEKGTDFTHSVGYEYDSKNNLTQQVENINGTDYTTSYTYDDDNRVKTVTTDASTVEYTYDDYGRISGQVTKYGTSTVLTESYTYHKSPTNGESPQIATHTIIHSNGTTVYTYAYDSNGNITSVSDGTNTTSYVYDSANQLIRENNQAGEFTHTWEYDAGGNILNRKEYDYTTGILEDITPTKTVAYNYGNVFWGDLLTKYDGQSITRDGIANPLSDGKRTYTWEHGRELASMSDGSYTYAFEYDANGMRTKKSTVGTSSSVSYVYNGSQLTQMKNASFTLSFTYDANGTPLTLTLNGTVYYYVTNIQGDVVAIRDANGHQKIWYEYDAWGNLVDYSGDGILYILNPLRYRGYVFDMETGLYYLQSRYYDPEMGRFINADDVDYLGADGSPLSYNLFAYCMNNPVNMTDDGGNLPGWATKLIIGTAVIAVAAVLTVATAGTGTALACFAVGALKGAAVGAAIGAASGAVTGAVGHRISTGSWDGAGQAALEGAADGYMSGAISGFISGGMTSNACFIAGTTVLTSIGYVTIENIKAGDHVWATDPETGETALKSVVQTFVNQATELVYVTVDGEEIVCTNEHPFYSPVKGWTAACKLRAGDILVTVNGEYVVVERIQHEILESPIAVYNFEVADFHTYYVGNTDILVHNLCNGKWTNTGRGSSSNAWYHFEKHGSEVGARTLEAYTNKATNFANQVIQRGIKGRYIPGATPNTYRYIFNGKYIDMAWNGIEHILVSFGRI